MRTPLSITLVILAMAGTPGAHPALGANTMRIEVHNPGQWDGPGLVEVPVGRLATPGLLDWRSVRLVRDGVEIPWSIREGAAHWKASLSPPGNKPRSEDLLVFSIAVPSGKTAVVDVVPGKPAKRGAMSRHDGRIEITYPDLRVRIDEKTGMLTEISAYGQPALSGAMSAAFYKLPGEGIELKWNLNASRPVGGTGRERPATLAAREPMGTYRAELVSSTSTGAMTEIHFVLDSGDGPDMALTYRVHVCGVVEVWADERPWTGRSPWVNYAAEFTLPISGLKEPLNHPRNIWPHYGFKEFVAVTQYADSAYTSSRFTAVELGEEIINGRRWNRRLYFAPASRSKEANELAAFAEKGFAVNVLPKRAEIRGARVRVSCGDSARAASEIIAKAAKRAGVEASVVSGSTPAEISLKLAAGRGAEGIDGDGFTVRPTKAGAGVEITAKTPLGLIYGALRVAEGVDDSSGSLFVPLIAGNPVVGLRAGGFGGGPFEVDFPYGSDAEWEHAFDGMISSGMNVIADLSMWGNWKMPVSYKYMPELRSDSPDAFDESSGTRFSEIEPNRARGLKLLGYLRDRGVRVWQWVPIGCVPTTYAKAHPDAMAPGSEKIPCFTHPLYAKYVEAFARELLETYPLDGIVMVRDDNGGLCTCDRCTEYIAKSRTKDSAWEQYLIIYDMLKGLGFHGEVGVYPYFDLYQPHLEALLPEDLLVVGHGAGLSVLTRSYETIGPMGDTWIDNIFAGFKLAPSTRMKRLLADRGSFWIGGAYCGTELAWESVGYFGWEPTAAVNTFRWWWGQREFGDTSAEAFTRLSDVVEEMWDLFQYPMLPRDWVRLAAEQRQKVSTDSRALRREFDARLAKLRAAVGTDDHAAWFAHVSLWGTFFEYYLRRLEIAAQMSELVSPHKDIVSRGGSLPAEVRTQLIALHREAYELADAYDKQAADVPGNMMAQVRAHGMTKPYREWMASFDFSLDAALPVKQFSADIEADPPVLKAGQPFAVPVLLRNTGMCPWLPEIDFSLNVGGDAARLGIPASTPMGGEPVVFGEERGIELRGTAPSDPGQCDVELRFRFTCRTHDPVASKKITLRWE